MKLKEKHFFLCAVMICALLCGACARSGSAPEAIISSTDSAGTAENGSPGTSPSDPDDAGSSPKAPAASSFIFPDNETPAGSSSAKSTAVSPSPSPSAKAPTGSLSPSPSANAPTGSLSPSPSAKAPTGSPSPSAKVPAGSLSPSPAKKPASSLDRLEKELEELISGYDGTWSVYCKRLDTEECFCINDKALISASLIKLFIFGAVMEAVEDGEMDLDYYSEPLELMIEYSDNDSANLLVEDMGGVEAVNKFIKKHGYKNTEMYRYLAEDSSRENYTSAKECGELLENVLDGKYVSQEASELLLYHLKNQYTLYKIPAGLPEGIKSASKSGELDDAQHDAAIIYSPACTYILVVMSNGLEPYYEGAEEAIDHICQISETVYNYLQTKLPDDD